MINNAPCVGPLTHHSAALRPLLAILQGALQGRAEGLVYYQDRDRSSKGSHTLFLCVHPHVFFFSARTFTFRLPKTLRAFCRRRYIPRDRTAAAVSVLAVIQVRGNQ